MRNKKKLGKRGVHLYLFSREKKSQAESFLNKGKWKVAFELIF